MTSTDRSPRGLLAELLLHGGVTVTTPDRPKEGDRLDLVTVIQADGTVITHISEDLVGSARLGGLFSDHLARVRGTLEPLSDLRRQIRAIRRRLAVLFALTSIVALWLPKVFAVDRWVTAHIGLGLDAQLGLVGLGSAVGAAGIVVFRDEVSAALGRLAARVLVWSLRFFARRLMISE